MLKIVHMPNSRSSRIVFVAEELRIPYEIDLRRRSELKKPDVLAINPFGAAPVIQDGDLKMMESMAIVQYLVERHDTENRPCPRWGARSARASAVVPLRGGNPRAAARRLPALVGHLANDAARREGARRCAAFARHRGGPRRRHTG
jgi:glutathione S-transferase